MIGSAKAMNQAILTHRFSQALRCISLCSFLVFLGSCLDFEALSGSDSEGFLAEFSAPEQQGPYPGFARAYRASAPRERATAAVARFAAQGLPGSVGEVASFLTEGIDDPGERARILHDWEALTISYDFQAFFSNQIPDQSAQSVLRSKKAVCAGYSNLYRALCREAGVPCSVIEGYGKGYGRGDPFTPMTLDRPNHDWNAVRLKDTWLLVDVTWDSGYIEPGVTGFKRRFSTDYFLSDPSVFVYDHLPSMQGWQLLAKPLSPQAFVDLPFLEPGYFSVFERPPAVPRKMDVAGTTDIRFPAPVGDTDLLVALYTYNPKAICTGAGDEIPSRGTVFMEDDEAVARFSFPKPGRYIALIFARAQGTEKYVSVATYGFDARGSSSSSFPTRYDAWGSSYRLMSPLLSPLVVGKAYRFRFRLPGETAVSLICGSDWKNFTPDADGGFDFRYTPPASGNVEICVRGHGGGSNSYSAILSYEVVAASP